jgi:hypothetical protein
MCALEQALGLGVARVEDDPADGQLAPEAGELLGRSTAASVDRSLSQFRTGPTNGTSYSYELTVVDHSGNESTKSSSVSATPLAGSSGGWTTLLDDQFNTDATAVGDVLGHWDLYHGPYGSAPYACANPTHDYISGGSLHLLFKWDSSLPKCGANDTSTQWYTGGMMVDAAYGGHDQRVTVRFRVVDSNPTFRAHRIIPMRFFADPALTWPEGGEEDWCEGDATDGCWTFFHPPAGNRLYWFNAFDESQWHTLSVSRVTTGTNVAVTETRDGAVIKSVDATTTDLPDTFKRVVLQQECPAAGCPPEGGSNTEDIQIDWIRIEERT